MAEFRTFFSRKEKGEWVLRKISRHWFAALAGGTLPGLRGWKGR
jgi:hypothetical protein